MTAKTTYLSKLRNQIFSRIGVKPAKRSKHLQKVDDQPDTFRKTTKMKMLEYKYHIKLEVILFNGTLTDVVCFLNGDIKRSTVSKWRKRFIKYGDRE